MKQKVMTYATITSPSPGTALFIVKNCNSDGNTSRTPREIISNKNTREFTSGEYFTIAKPDGQSKIITSSELLFRFKGAHKSSHVRSIRELVLEIQMTNNKKQTLAIRNHKTSKWQDITTLNDQVIPKSREFKLLVTDARDYIDLTGSTYWLLKSSIPSRLNLKYVEQRLNKDKCRDPTITCVNGVDGRDGVDGLNGKDGTDGADGKDGTDGVDGLNGKDGTDGADGRDGVDGKDGIVRKEYCNIYKNAGKDDTIVILKSNEFFTVQSSDSKVSELIKGFEEGKDSTAIYTGDGSVVALHYTIEVGTSAKSTFSVSMFVNDKEVVSSRATIKVGRTSTTRTCPVELKSGDVIGMRIKNDDDTENVPIAFFSFSAF